MTRKTLTKRFGGTDRAVSPVIGVILMVAITVILAAVIGTFVLDLGQNAGQAAPQATLSVTASVTNDNVTVSHEGGDGLAADRTRVTIEDDAGSLVINTSGSGTFAVGDEVTYQLNNGSNEEVGWANRQAESDNTDGISDGEQLTVTLVDTETQRIIYETTLTA